ncbi:MAG TPA: LuxR C-terminal-related transcriptional regulator, partial [Acidimicrobiales bacterium]|nr:LuxR C-terminal-related transcriptional regulator [Acidimicrobiales bacterium]
AAEVSGGTFDAYRATRRVRTANHEICARIWTQAIDVDGRRLGVSVVVDEADMGRLGKHPKKARLDLVPIAVGALDDAWTIVSVSTEIEDLIHRSASECAGLCLLDLVHPDDAAGLRGQDGKPGGEPLYRAYVRFSDPVTGWSEACMMIGPLPGRPEHLFALVGALESGQQPSWDRVAELEMALRRIGAEVRAAGALEMIGGIATPVLPQLGELSTRQWEVLSRLLQGERVSTIARELYLSESTVRNHLATIFRRFRVHTQSELLELLRGKTAGAQ